MSRQVSSTRASLHFQCAGNTTTLAHYLELLGNVGMLTGLSKFAGEVVRARGSSPKLQVFNTALMSAASALSPGEAREDRQFWGRLLESGIGAHLANAAASRECELFYWRDRNREVDFVVRKGSRLLAIEVNSAASRHGRSGLRAFEETFGPCRTLIVGRDGVAPEEFLSRPVADWLSS